jgi:Helix-turn-helix domain
MATVLQAYQFALDPVPRTQGSLASHAGAALFAYNWGLELVKSRLDQRRAGQDVEGAVDAAGTATGVEPRQAPGRPLVATQQQGGLQQRPGRARAGIEELERLPQPAP